MSTAHSIHANGTDIHYQSAGTGDPLLLLHGGIVSANPVWGPHPFAYASHIDTLAQHFRVIAPDARGYGRTVNTSGGQVLYDQLADDVFALADVLGLEQPLLCGFSDGAVTATIAAIRRPDAVRALVNHAGYDFFNPEAPSFTLMRQTLGGSPQATAADPDAVARWMAASPQMAMTFELMKADHDAGQGEGHWRSVIAETFERCTTSPGYTFGDLGRIVAPTLILTGDRDQFCSVEEGVTAYRALTHGELAVLPNAGHAITPAAVTAAIDFLSRAS